VSRLVKTICLLSALSLAAKAKPADNKNLLGQLEDIKPNQAIDINNLPGDTNTEKLLYLLDTPTATKSGVLIFLDSQIEAFETAGNKEQAEALKANRVLLTQAVDETMEVFVKEAASVYDGFFTADEIDQLTKVFSQPIMQKYIASTIDVQQKLLPGAQTWSENHVVPRYTQLIQEQAEK